MKTDKKRNAAKVIVKTLNCVLCLEANTNSSIWAYQPAHPTKLDRFKKIGK